jgi:sugar O-acyltransferase (sialic acid O-acetyltransferase NeuD family)
MTIVIIGAAGHGREVLDVVEASGLPFAGFVDDGSPDLEPLARREARVLGGLEALVGLSATVLLGLGDSRVRQAVGESVTGVRWATAIVHPLASTGRDVELGEGTVLTAGARLTTHIAVGRHGYVGPNATIGHDAVLGDYVTVLPGATVSGNVVLEPGASIGTGANVRQGIRVGAGAIVGAGAVVVGDVAPGTTVVGVPARPRR